jgi:hypothetical protein
METLPLTDGRQRRIAAAGLQRAGGGTGVAQAEAEFAGATPQAGPAAAQWMWLADGAAGGMPRCIHRAQTLMERFAADGIAAVQVAAAAAAAGGTGAEHPAAAARHPGIGAGEGRLPAA